MKKLVALAGMTVGALAVAVAPVSGAPASAQPSLRQYLAAMSWPMRASVGRTAPVRDSIDGFLGQGDPPYLGGIAFGCRNLRAVEARGHLLRIEPPASLEGTHARLSQAYSNMRADCREARLAALEVVAAMNRASKTGNAKDKAALERTAAAARLSLRRFEQTTLRSFIDAARVWRAATLRYAAAVGVPPPKWLKALPLGR